ncbi:hypothetical protein EZS27_004960 [termite gut metagenome]|uniref:Uncharacterized protein n=1 Tax=termite gut metagenome TaxID=433724 RepID=A0A5J4SMX5_9ZZZZ
MREELKDNSYLCKNKKIMNTSDNTILLDNYLGLLKGLSRENKIGSPAYP